MYVYIESSSPQKAGDDAALLSGVLPARQDTCLSFFYNMYGENMGQLMVELEVSKKCCHLYWAATETTLLSNCDLRHHLSGANCCGLSVCSRTRHLLYKEDNS